MQMNYGVQQFASVVTLTAGGCTYDVSLLVNKRKLLFELDCESCCDVLGFKLLFNSELFVGFIDENVTFSENSYGISKDESP